jgi:hypothetical protein
MAIWFLFGFRQPQVWQKRYDLAVENGEIEGRTMVFFVDGVGSKMGYQWTHNGKHQ